MFPCAVGFGRDLVITLLNSSSRATADRGPVRVEETVFSRGIRLHYSRFPLTFMATFYLFFPRPVNLSTSSQVSPQEECYGTGKAKFGRHRAAAPGSPGGRRAGVRGTFRAAPGVSP